MPMDINSFGVGGEGLGGLFMGNQMAQQRDAAELERQKAMVDMANTQEITRQRQLGNQYSEAVMPDQISEYKNKVANAQQDRQAAQFAATGEKFGQLGQTLTGIPAAARPAALRQMAKQAGIADDNPMLQQLSSVDPEKLPEVLTTFSKGFYEQSDKARAETLKRDMMYKQAEMQASGKNDIAQIMAESRKYAADQAADARKYAADQAREARAAAAANKPAGLTFKSTDMAIANSIMNDPNLTEEQKRAALQQHTYNKAVVGKPGTTEEIMGLPSPQERAATAAGASPTKGGPTKGGVPTVSSTADYAKLPKGAEYIDPKGVHRTKQ